MKKTITTTLYIYESTLTGAHHVSGTMYDNNLDAFRLIDEVEETIEYSDNPEERAQKELESLAAEAEILKADYLGKVEKIQKRMAEVEGVQ